MRFLGSAIILFFVILSSFSFAQDFEEKLLDSTSIFSCSVPPLYVEIFKPKEEQDTAIAVVKIGDDYNFPGDSTNSSIHAGVIGGVCNEIMGFITKIDSKHDNIEVILTGGNAKFLSKRLKITIFANQNFILEGLNCILNLNK